MVLPIFVPYMNRFIKHKLYGYDSFLFSKMIFRLYLCCLIVGVLCGCPSSFICILLCLKICSHVDGHLSSFQFGNITNKASVNGCVCV